MKYNRATVLINLVLVVLELVALIHDITVFGAGLFKWYTIDSNVLQLIVSGLIVCCFLQGRELPNYVTALHFISAVGLTVTFLIAALVLSPEGGIRYYFIENVAPINHLIAPALSVLSLLFFEKTKKMSVRVVLLPAALSLLYGLICLALNKAGFLEGPYFFLEAGKQPVSLIVTWFGIIAVLCIALASLYYWIKYR